MIHNAFIQEFLYPHHFSAFGLACLIAAMILIFAFELWMLVDVLAFRKVPAKSRFWWVVGMFAIHPFVAIVYLFMRSRYKVIK